MGQKKSKSKRIIQYNVFIANTHNATKATYLQKISKKTKYLQEIYIFNEEKTQNPYSNSQDFKNVSNRQSSWSEFYVPHTTQIQTTQTIKSLFLT